MFTKPIPAFNRFKQLFYQCYDITDYGRISKTVHTTSSVSFCFETSQGPIDIFIENLLDSYIFDYVKDGKTLFCITVDSKTLSISPRLKINNNLTAHCISLAVYELESYLEENMNEIKNAADMQNKFHAAQIKELMNVG